MISLGLKSEYIMSLFGVPITNTFLTTIIVSVLLIVLSIFFYFKKDTRDNIVINVLRIFIFEILKFIDSITGSRKMSKQVLPLVSTFFIFILTANLLALIPGFLGSLYVHTAEGNLPLLKSPNSDLTTTLALALFSVVSIQFFSIRILGIKLYIARFINFAGPIKFITGFFEMISEGVKILSFSFRLFGNIFAGEALLVVIAFLVPYIIPLPFIFLEIFVGIIQAFVFAMLTLTFLKIGTIRHLPVTRSTQTNQ